MELNRFEMRTEPEFRAGVATGIEAVRELFKLTDKECMEVFGEMNVTCILHNFNSVEIMERMNTHFNNLPRVGDYLISKDTNHAWYVLDTSHGESKNGYITALDSKGVVKKVFRNSYGSMTILDRDGGRIVNNIIATLDKVQKDATKGEL